MTGSLTEFNSELKQLCLQFKRGDKYFQTHMCNLKKTQQNQQCSQESCAICFFSQTISEVVFEKAYCEYRLNRVESSLKTIESAPEQTDKLKELYGQVVRLFVVCCCGLLFCGVGVESGCSRQP